MQEIQMNGESRDLTKDNIEKLKEIFPEVFNENKIDFDKLQVILGENIDTEDEKYRFTWNGKMDSIRLSQSPSLGTLRPCKEDSKDWDNTQNLYIEGDNLEVLKLLQNSYLNKIKLIYIDPPYNTGNDFVYKDDFKDNIDNYKKYTGQVDSEGNLTTTNKETDGRYHTNWLNMMYPRLRLARNLLADDGVIFISIDDNESCNLKKMCDEIFGEDNYESDFYMKVRHENRILREDIRYQLVIEHVLCYRKKSYNPNRRPKLKNAEDDYIYDIEITGTPKEVKKIGLYDVEIYNQSDYKIIKKDAGEGSLKEYQIRGSLISQSGSASEYYEMHLRQRRDADGEGALYKVIGMGIKGDGLGYRYIRQPQDYNFKNGFYYQGKPIANTQSKGLPYANFYDFTNETNKVGFEGNIDFKNGKKPIALLEQLFEIANLDTNAIVMDFFSGSSSTAHAVMDINSKDGGNRKFIMVQLPELNSEKNLEQDYKTICDIAKERIRRSGEEIKDSIQNDPQLKINDIYKKVPDIGFKVFKLDSSNIRKWNPDTKDLERSLLDQINNFVDGRTELDALYEIILKCGLELTVPVEELNIKDKKVYSVAYGALIVCLDNNITLDVANEIAKIDSEFVDKQNVTVVFKDNGFANDSVKTNIKETMRAFGIGKFITV